MSLVARRIGWTFLAAAPLLAALSCYLNWQSGCLFDWKQGIGDYAAADHKATLAFLSMIAAWVCLPIAVTLIWRATVPVFLGSVLFFGMIAAPLAPLMLISAGDAGTRACGP
jgi:hypothetical protein